MKRASTPIPKTAPPRRRALSQEERALWESVAIQIKPLRKKPRAPKSATVEQAAIAVSAATKPPPHKTSPSNKVPPPPPLAPLGRRERSKLSRGRKPIDARLDLHGMTQTRAHSALKSFLQRASSDGLSFVLIITGKGAQASESGRGVLRRYVPEWLSL